MKKLPKEFKEFQWIADRFAKIKGVEMILLSDQAKGSELNMMITNNSPGESKKVFIMPLRTTFYIDYSAAPTDCPNNWDINQFENPDMIMLLAEAKAKVVFEDVRPN